MRKRLDALGLRYEIVDAVDGFALDMREYAGRLRADKWRKLRGRELSPGEIGCYLSHYQLWERIAAEEKECAVVLEDDAIPRADFAAVIAKLPLLPWEWDVVLLSARKRYAADCVLCEIGETGRRLVRYRRRVGTTRAYIITAKGARKLCDYCYEIRAPVDWSYAEWWRNGVAFYGADPAAASHAQTPSTIGKPRRLPRTLGERIAAAATMHRDWWRRHIFRWTHPPQKKTD